MMGFQGRTPPWFAMCVVLLLPCCAEAQPTERGKFRSPDLVELVKLDSTIRLDIRYATSNNFMKRPMYTQARAFLQRPAAEALVLAHRTLCAQGFGILVFDGYRPWSVTKKFWDETPPAKRKFVANPAQGSRHNRGCAVDCSVYDLRTGKEVEMPSPYDDFTEKAAANYTGGTERQRKARGVLRGVMKRHGYVVHPEEWWHFDFKDWKEYKVMDIPFESLGE
jgi:D-alanyl-D-alanine dipeptidase